MKRIIENIYMTSGVMFKNHEKLLITFFPQPKCQLFTFKFPSSLQPGLKFYKQFPRILSVFINKHLEFKSISLVFVNSATAPSLPQIFHPPLKVFNEIFTSLKSKISNKRTKRGAFNRFFEYIFGDADMRLRNLETMSMQEL
jgi:hypothetical protein